jgi:hypothetical protein
MKPSTLVTLAATLPGGAGGAPYPAADVPFRRSTFGWCRSADARG